MYFTTFSVVKHIYKTYISHISLQRRPQMQQNDSSAHLNSNEEALGLRQQYLLEKDRIISEIGSLKDIPARLGLSQRRLCRLLLVDPSAWTRWNKTGAPPHIYQALRWLMELQKQNPTITGPIDFSERLDRVQNNTQSKIAALELTIARLELKLSQMQESSTIQLVPPPDAIQITAQSTKRNRRKPKKTKLKKAKAKRIKATKAKPKKRQKPKPVQKQRPKAKRPQVRARKK